MEKEGKRPAMEMPTTEIEGIGLEFAKKLAHAGIYSVGDLVFIDPEIEYARLGSEISLKYLKEWKAMATLMQIPRINNQFAEALVRGGLYSVEDLFNPPPSEIIKVIEQAHEKNLVPKSADLLTVVEWQKEALKLAYTSGIRGSVFDSDTRQPIRDVAVTCSNASTNTNERGEFVLNLISQGKKDVVLEKEGFYDFDLKIEVGAKTSEITAFLRKSSDGYGSPIHCSEYDGQHVDVGPNDKLLMKQKELSEIPDGTYLCLLKFYKKEPKTKLLSLCKYKIGKKVFIDIVKVGDDSIPDDSEEGTILRKQGGALKSTTFTFEDYSKHQFEREMGMSFDTFNNVYVMQRGE